MSKGIIVAAALALAGCAGTTPAQVGAQLQTIQPVASAYACEAQQLANLTGATFEAAKQAQAAAGSAIASAIAGIWCNGLAAGAPLPTPVPVAGTAMVNVANGAITVPVPVVAAPAG